MVINVINTIGTILYMAHLSISEAHPGPLLGIPVLGAFYLVFFLLGRELRAGKRQAVIFLCILCGLSLIIAGATLGGHEGQVGAAMGGFALFCVPPIVSALRHWGSLT
jgi:hypothetical protein